jgi:methylmalonyl-CoA/ethylmalonyl-CoA epimerase
VSTPAWNRGRAKDATGLRLNYTSALVPLIAARALRDVVVQFNFHHVGIAVRDLAPAIQNYSDLFGYRLVDGPYDDPTQEVSVCFLSRGGGDPLLELVAPLGSTSPVITTLKKGGGTYHICYEVPELAAAITHLTDRESVLLKSPVPAIAFGMRPIAWLMTEGHLLVELLQAGLAVRTP